MATEDVSCALVVAELPALSCFISTTHDHVCVCVRACVRACVCVCVRAFETKQMSIQYIECNVRMKTKFVIISAILVVSSLFCKIIAQILSHANAVYFVDK